MDPSLIHPHRTALVGIKPTVGAISRSGYHPAIIHTGYSGANGADNRRCNDNVQSDGRAWISYDPVRRKDPIVLSE